MGRVSPSDHLVYEHRSGGGCLIFLGLPFLLGGIFGIMAPGLPEFRRTSDVPWYVMVPAGLLFVALGATIALLRRGTIIDLRVERVTSWWGLLVPFGRTEMPLVDFDRVVLTESVQRSRGRRYLTYPVHLIGQAGRRVRVEIASTPAKALRLGEEVAKFARLTLEDRTQGSPIVRTAEELGQSVRERKEAAGSHIDVPDAPPGCRSRHEVLGDTLTFHIPGPGLDRASLLSILFGLAVPLGICLLMLLPMYRRGAVVWPVMALLAALLVVAPFVLFCWLPLCASRLRVRIDVSPEELRATYHGIVRRRSRALPTHAVRELEVLGRAVQASTGRRGGVIVARSPQGMLAFGRGLSAAELHWMRAVIWNVITA